MSFGFSVGDFVAAGKLIASIISGLRSVGGSASEYQELERELHGLQRALSEIEHLRGTQEQQISINAIKCAALNCQYVLEEFAEKVTKYKKSLGFGERAGKLRKLERKARWRLEMKDAVLKLRAYLIAHVGSINMRLMTSHSVRRVEGDQTDAAHNIAESNIHCGNIV
ncbi:MAG: hypothetical protein M1830_007366 [Pleopsidium flavum]|nr:MAG: hypothetical protein M1830_007366 [Pleopsidium flavum]